MRLFAAIDFDTRTKNKISDIQETLKYHCTKGRFTRPENFHLTLVFFGQKNPKDIPGLEDGISRVNFSPFVSELCEIGFFMKGNRKIWWVGLKDEGKLISLRKNLLDNLGNEYSENEKNKFNPHITLCREAVTLPDFDHRDFNRNFPVTKTKIDRIHLMKSERDEGILKYTSIFSKELICGRYSS